MTGPCIRVETNCRVVPPVFLNVVFCLYLAMSGVRRGLRAEGEGVHILLSQLKYSNPMQ